jgi:hypothetical protein
VIKLSEAEWSPIYNSIAREFPASYLLIRDVQRRELGFTVRRHQAWVPKMDGGYYGTEIHLDFYDEAKETWFRMKYL